jgi:acetoin utilization deacetylase AcuC-like enzyme
VGHAQIECAPQHGSAILEDIDTAKVVPKTERDGGQQQSAAAAAPVRHGGVSLGISDVQGDGFYLRSRTGFFALGLPRKVSIAKAGGLSPLIHLAGSYHEVLPELIMLPFKLIYSDDYYLPIGAHLFPAEKYRLVHERLLQTGVAEASDFITPQPASDQDILLVHTPEYVKKLKTGTLSPLEEMQMEIPYSPELVGAFWLAAGGSILAAEHALEERVAFNIGGGFHHAFPDHGEGFCMIHDVAVAIRRLERDGKIRTAMTVDCDVHHGNGTAAIFAAARTTSEPLPSVSTSGLRPPGKIRRAQSGDVFTISLHQQDNYPAWKPPSSIDVDLPDGIGDDDYLAWLDNTLSSGLRQFEPDLLCYVAGADPYREDQLGGLALTIEGLKKRDELVFRVARAKNIPVVVTYAGGYARKIEDTVTIHSNTVIAAKEVLAAVSTRS